MRIVAMCSIILTLLFPWGKKMESFESVADCFSKTKNIEVTIENVSMKLVEGDGNFEKVLSALNKITEYAHDMPAFGVSIDNLTVEERKKGVWLELEFKNTLVFNEMTFDALLVNVEKEAYGFNLIRRNNGKYDGRCFYLSLRESMNELYKTIINL